MAEENLLKSYPTGKGTRYAREFDLKRRLELRQFGKDFFDGSRDEGYGGYNYDGRWEVVAKDMIERYNLTNNSKILDVGCAKGFILYEFTKLLPGVEVVGTEISQYCLDNAKEEVKDKLLFMDAGEMDDFKNNQFDLVLAINTIHNLPFESCMKATKDIERIGKNKYIQVDAWENKKQRDDFRNWQITGGFFDSDGNWVAFGTAFSTNGWKEFFKLIEYTGEYNWTIVEF